MSNNLNLLDEELDFLIDERLEILNEFDPITIGAVGTGIMHLSRVLGIISMITAGYYNYFSKEAQACLQYAGSTKTICRLNFKIKGARDVIAKLNQTRSKCGSILSGDKSKCNDRINNKIQKFQDIVNQSNKRLVELRSYNISN